MQFFAEDVLPAVFFASSEDETGIIGAGQSSILFYMADEIFGCGAVELLAGRISDLSV